MCSQRGAPAKDAGLGRAEPLVAAPPLRWPPLRDCGANGLIEMEAEAPASIQDTAPSCVTLLRSAHLRCREKKATASGHDGMESPGRRGQQGCGKERGCIIPVTQPALLEGQQELEKMATMLQRRVKKAEALSPEDK